jgi:hypothetical protein
MTSFVNFISAIHGLSVTGVVRKFNHTPLQINTADMPAQMLDFGGLSQNDDMTTCIDDGYTHAVDLVIVLQPAGQDNPGPNYSAQATMVDSLRDKLKALGSNYFFSIEAGVEPILGISSWVVRASVELRE